MTKIKQSQQQADVNINQSHQSAPDNMKVTPTLPSSSSSLDHEIQLEGSWTAVSSPARLGKVPANFAFGAFYASQKKDTANQKSYQIKKKFFSQIFVTVQVTEDSQLELCEGLDVKTVTRLMP